MHLGNAYSALLSWLSVKSRGGAWILRIEDLDPGRSRLEYARQIEEDLRWLGLNWDAGGVDEGLNAAQSFMQSRRGALYAEHLQRLWQQGLVYPCHCTRADIMATQAPHESDGRIVYQGTCRPTQPLTGQTPEGQKLRLIVPDEDIRFTDLNYGAQTVNLATHCGDFIIRRADGAWAYQLAVVVDDALMGVTEVVRGCDLLLSAAQQIYLFRLLGYPTPTFCHVPLLCNTAGQRLSKRDASLDLGALRSRYSAEDVIGILAHAAGLIDRREPVSAHDLMPLFSWAKVGTENITVEL